MGRQSIRPYVDLALGGKLYDFLATRRESGASFDSIARELATEHDIHVTAQTVRVWCKELDVPKPERAA